MARPSPALVIACVALAVALGGTSYAAVKLPRNSVGNAQIKANAVTSAKVANGTLLAADLKPGVLPAAGFSSTETKTDTESIAVFTTLNVVAQCEAPRTHVVGGGFLLEDAGQQFLTVIGSYPNPTGDGWIVRVYNVHPTNSYNATAYAVCA